MRKLVFIVATVLFWPILSQAAYTIKDGKLIATHELATLSVQEHYGLAKEALESQNWQEAVRQSQIVIKNFSDTAFARDACFYLGVSYFNLDELDFSNRYFSAYLKKQAGLKFFEEAMKYKFLIAQQFANGTKKRLLGRESMPKWMPAREEAIEIYDEVIMALPQHDLAIQSLFGKANVLCTQEEFKSSIETFQTLLRRFPKHPLAQDSYVSITKVYQLQAEKEYPDPDYLDLAEINVKKFKINFPGDPKIFEAEKSLAQMTELYAGKLYETAQFYEKTKKPSASVIYYAKIMSKYPHTQVAIKANSRLEALQVNVKAPPASKGPAVIVDSFEVDALETK